MQLPSLADLGFVWSLFEIEGHICTWSNCFLEFVPKIERRASEIDSEPRAPKGWKTQIMRKIQITY